MPVRAATADRGSARRQQVSYVPAWEQGLVGRTLRVDTEGDEVDTEGDGQRTLCHATY